MSDIPTLSPLLSRSWQVFQKRLVPIVVIAVVLGGIMGIAQTRMAKTVSGSIAQISQNMNADKLKELTTRMQNGDQAAQQEFTQLMQQGLANGKAGLLFGSMAKAFTGSIILAVLFGVVSQILLLLLVVSDASAMEALRKTPSIIFPLLGLHIWIFLRTFLWIPIIGIIPAIILGPRFIASPVILVTEGKGVMQSASESYARTAGLWGKIVGNMIVAALCAGLVSWAASLVLGLFLGSLMSYLSPIISSLTSSYTFVFGTILGLALARHVAHTAPTAAVV